MTRVRIVRRNKRCKTWAKVITGVDRTKKGGYAILGDFLDVDAEVDLPEGTLVAKADDDDIRLQRVHEGGRRTVTSPKSRGGSITGRTSSPCWTPSSESWAASQIPARKPSRKSIGSWLSMVFRPTNCS